MAPFYGWGSTASRLEPLQGGSLLFTTKLCYKDVYVNSFFPSIAILWNFLLWNFVVGNFFTGGWYLRRSDFEHSNLSQS